MKYSIRNSLILATTLLLLAGGGWFYISYTFNPQIEETELLEQEKEQELNELTNLANQFSTAQASYNQAIYTRLNHPKELFMNHNSSRLFEYLRQLNQDISFTELNYTLQDSILNNDHGIIRTTIEGEGRYENLKNFIYRMEYSRPLLRVTSVQLSNIEDLERIENVNFQIGVDAFYRRGEWTNYIADLYTSGPLGTIRHNPFYPLIRAVPPNTDNMLDVDASRLVGIAGRRALVIDQDGTLNRLEVGDRVYLGSLRAIYPDRGEAEFQLNRGGIMDQVILKIEREN